MYTAEQIKTVLCFVFGGLIREAITLELLFCLVQPQRQSDLCRRTSKRRAYRPASFQTRRTPRTSQRSSCHLPNPSGRTSPRNRLTKSRALLATTGRSVYRMQLHRWASPIIQGLSTNSSNPTSASLLAAVHTARAMVEKGNWREVDTNKGKGSRRAKASMANVHQEVWPKVTIKEIPSMCRATATIKAECADRLSNDTLLPKEFCDFCCKWLSFLESYHLHGRLSKVSCTSKWPSRRPLRVTLPRAHATVHSRGAFGTLGKDGQVTQLRFQRMPPSKKRCAKEP